MIHTHTHTHNFSVQDVQMNILQTIEDLLRSEISLIRLMRESVPDTNDLNPLMTNETVILQSNHNIPFDIRSSPSSSQQQLNATSNITEDNSSNTPQIENGDLAEADQSRLELEDDDEEGAVGGMLNITDECSSNNAEQVICLRSFTFLKVVNIIGCICNFVCYLILSLFNVKYLIDGLLKRNK